MKKGLLSLLALALTVVGCQNYDDQFDALTELIEGVQSDVDGLSALENDVDALAATIAGLATAESVSGLASSISDVEDDVAGVAASVSPLAQALTDLEADVAALQTAINNAADADDVAALTAQLDAVQEDLDELLAANNVIDQDLTITNTSNLAYVESLISTGTDAPLAILNKALTIDSDFAEDDASLATRINDVTAKIKTVLGDIKVTHTADAVVNFPALVFADANVTINTANTFDQLITITDNFDCNVAGAIVANALTTVGSMEISSKITSLDLTGVTVTNALSTKGSGTGIIYAPAATGAINAGTAQVTKVLADKATSITLGATKYFAEFDIDADKATAITLANTSAGNISIDADDETVVTMDALTKVGTITTDEVAELHLAGLTTVSSTIVAVVNTALDIAALKSITNTASIEDIETVNAPALSLTTTLTLADATDITVKNIAAQTTAGSNVLVAGKVEDLTISELGATQRLDINKEYPELVNLTVTGKVITQPTATTQTTSIVVDSGAADLKTITIGGQIDHLKATASPKMTTVTTQANSQLRVLELDNNDKLTSLSLDHAHIDGSNGAEMIVKNNDALGSITASNFDEAGKIEITSNTKLSSLSFPELDTPINSPSVMITVTGNYLGGAYVSGVASTVTSPYAEAKIKSNDILDIVNYIKAYGNTNSPTYKLELTTVTSQTQTSAGVEQADTTTYSNTLANIISGDTSLPETGVSGLVSNTGGDHYFLTRISAE